MGSFQEDVADTDDGSLRVPKASPLVHVDDLLAVQEEAEQASHHIPPNGGLSAWLQGAGSFFLFFKSWGIVNTFGVFQTYYQTASLREESPSNISWIGAIQAFLLLLIGVLTGPLYDAGYFQALISTGSFFIALGFVMTSLCSQYWQVMLAQAICLGLGTGYLYVPAVAIMPQYFTTKRALATGIAASGSSLGGVLYPIVFRQLQPTIGFGWATRVLGFISLATCFFSCSPRSENPLLLLLRRHVFGYVGFFGPIFYIQPYAIETKAMSENLAFCLLPTLNAASIPGRIVPAFLAGTIGPINTLLPAATVTGVLALCWIGIHHTAGLVWLAGLYGFASGAFVSLPSVALMSLTPDHRTLGTRMGMCSVMCGLGSLCVTPVSGAILRATGSYLGVQLFSGTTILLTGLLSLVTRFAKAGSNIQVKV